MPQGKWMRAEQGTHPGLRVCGEWPAVGRGLPCPALPGPHLPLSRWLECEGRGVGQQGPGELGIFIFEMTLFARGAGCLKF